MFAGLALAGKSRYNDGMSAVAKSRILDQVLDPVGECLTPVVAARIAALRAAPALQKRIGELAERNAEGKLSSREETEYAAYVEALDVIAVLQAKARRALKSADGSR